VRCSPAVGIYSVMRTSSRRVAGVLGCALLASVYGCHDSAGPTDQPGASLSRTSGSRSLHEDSVTTQRDSVAIVMSGPDSASMAWTVSHTADEWIRLVDSVGQGSGFIRWERDTWAALGGTHVDTISVHVPAIPTTLRYLDSLTVRETPSLYVALRRPWLPGERDAAIADIQRSGAFGQFSSLAPLILGQSDSVTTVVRNPLVPGATGFAGSLAAMFSSSWNVSGLYLYQVDNSHLPHAVGDTLQWLQVFWYNPAEPTWKGFAVAASSKLKFGPTRLATTSFDASGGQTGAGGGEARGSTSEYWEANGGTIAITATTGFTTFSPLTSGMWTGGQYSIGTLSGRLLNVSMPRVLPSPVPATLWSYDFRQAAISAIRVNCIFPSPCTGAAAQAVAALMRQARSGRTPGVSAVMEARRPVLGQRSTRR